MENKDSSTNATSKDVSNESNVVPFPLMPKNTQKSKLLFGCIIGAFVFLMYLFKSEFFPDNNTKIQEEQKLSLLDLNFTPFVNKETLPKGTLKFYKKDEKGEWISESKSLNDFKGKPMIVHLWATYCGPCVKELPIYDQFVKTVDKDIQNIAVMVGKATPQDIEAFYTQKNIKNLTVVVDEKNVLAQAYQIQAIPTSVFISASGKPMGYISGIVSWEDANVVALLTSLLKKI